eukprot:GFKZ01002322.1.p1 GENE.GFKZ01002322.1~~GFKZ01002322.1.p1  ORF type:complete len:322 (+),score=56.51 GFKZ01002322.1:291-1256(+)
MHFRAAYLPPPVLSPSPPPTCQHRVAISPASHRGLSLLASKRFQGVGSISKLGSVVLDQYLSHLENAYFGAPKLRSCQPIPASARNVDAVLFDMDGVLCNSEVASRNAAVSMFKQFYGLDVRADDFAPFTGTGEANFLGGVADVYGVASFDRELAKEQFFQVYTEGKYTEDLEAFPGVVGLVQRMKTMGLKVAVASAADAVKVDANLKAIGLPRDMFDFVTSSEGIANKKPAPDVFLAAAKGCGVEATRCVVVEDAVAGVVAAKSAGMRCIAVETSLDGEELKKAGADVVRREPATIEVRDIFGEDVVFAGGRGDGEGAAV